MRVSLSFSARGLGVMFLGAGWPRLRAGTRRKTALLFVMSIQLIV